MAPRSPRVATLDQDKRRVLDGFAATSAMDQEFNFGGFARIPGTRVQLRNA